MAAKESTTNTNTILRGAKSLIEGIGRAVSTKMDSVNTKAYIRPVGPSRAEIKAGKKAELAELVGEHDLQFVYVRDANYYEGNAQSKGGMVIAYRPLLPSGTIVELSTAICNKKDCFDKVEGRLIAAKNFAAGKKIKVPVKEKDKYAMQLANLFEPLVTTPFV